MLTARFLAMPVIALTVIAALAQAHSRPDMSPTDTRTVYRAVNCATQATDPSCALAGNARATTNRQESKKRTWFMAGSEVPTGGRERRLRSS